MNPGPAHDRTLGRISLPFLPFFLTDVGWGGVANRQEKNIDFWWIFWFYMALYGFIWSYYGLMWLKQCHKRTIPQITIFIYVVFLLFPNG